ncbi:MAG: SseB family protein [Streptosporangiaceae bacterium]
MSGHLNPGGQQFRGDRGAADPRVAAALAAWQSGQGSEQAALTALAATRLLVPVIAVLADPAADSPAPADHDKDRDQDRHKDHDKDRDKNSEMVMPTLIGQDGRPAVPAFTSLDALARWRPDARPVPAEADRVWRAAVADGCAVVIDVAGPVPLAVEGARLAALAARQPVPPPYDDPDVQAQVEAALTEAALTEAAPAGAAPAGPAQAGAPPAEAAPAIAGFSLASGRADGIDLTVTLHVAGPGWEAAANRAAAAIAARLAGRLRRGIEIIIAE